MSVWFVTFGGNLENLSHHSLDDTRISGIFVYGRQVRYCLQGRITIVNKAVKTNPHRNTR